jgi:hypothetical protein
MLRVHFWDKNNTQGGGWWDLGGWVDRNPASERQRSDGGVATIEFDIIDALSGLLPPIVPVNGMFLLLWNDGRAADSDPLVPANFTYFFGGTVRNVAEGDGKSPVQILWHVTVESDERLLNVRLERIVFTAAEGCSVRLHRLFTEATTGDAEHPPELEGQWNAEQYVDFGPYGNGFVQWPERTPYDYRSLADIIEEIRTYGGPNPLAPVKARNYFISCEWSVPSDFPEEGEVVPNAVTHYINYYLSDEEAPVLEPYLLVDRIDPTYTDAPQIMYYADWERHKDATPSATGVYVQGPASEPTDVTWDEGFAFGVKALAGRLIKGNFLPSWEGGHDYKEGDAVQPKEPNGWFYVSLSDGHSANDCEPPDSEEPVDCWDGEPEWVEEEGARVEDCPDDIDLDCFLWEARRFGDGWNAGAISNQSFDEGEWNVHAVVERSILAFDSGKGSDADFLDKLEYPDPNGKWHYVGEGGGRPTRTSTGGGATTAWRRSARGRGATSTGSPTSRRTPSPAPPSPTGSSTSSCSAPSIRPGTGTGTSSPSTS